MLGDSQIRGPSTASFVITGIQVGKLRAVRLQPMFLVACKLIMCRFLIIPETHFPLKITFFSPYGNFSFMLYSPLGFLSNYFFLYCLIKLRKKLKPTSKPSMPYPYPFIRSLTDSPHKHSLRVTVQRGLCWVLGHKGIYHSSCSQKFSIPAKLLGRLSEITPNISEITSPRKLH